MILLSFFATIHPSADRDSRGRPRRHVDPIARGQRPDPAGHRQGRGPHSALHHGPPLEVRNFYSVFKWQLLDTVSTYRDRLKYWYVVW